MTDALRFTVPSSKAAPHRATDSDRRGPAFDTPRAGPAAHARRSSSSTTTPVEVRLPGVGARLAGMGALVVLVSALILFGAADSSDLGAPLPEHSSDVGPLHSTSSKIEAPLFPEDE